MTMGSLDGVGLIEVRQDVYRNIVSLRTSRDLFDDLSDDPGDWQAAIQLEIAHKPQHYQSTQPLIHRPFEEAEYHSAVRYPFDNWSHSRYSCGSFGVWYGAPELETTIYETVHHWRHGLLADAGWADMDDVSIERRVHQVHCRAALINLLPYTDRWPALRSNDYGPCQALGERLHREGHPGLWAPSARCEGIVSVAFTPNILSDPRTSCFLSYTLRAGKVTVSRQPDTVFMTI